MVPGRVKEEIIEDIKWFSIGSNSIEVSMSKQIEQILNNFCKNNRASINKYKKDPAIKKRFEERNNKFKHVRGCRK